MALQEFVRGWRSVAGSVIGIAIGVSSLYFYSLGIFIKPIAEEFGLGRGAASLGAFMGTASAAIMAIPVGRLVDRLGSLRVAIPSLVLLALCLVALGALTRDLTSFLVLTTILSLLTAGSTPLPYTRMVVSGFGVNRGLALGIILAGSGIGAMLVPLLLAPFVAQHGWRAGYYSMATVILFLLPAVWWLLLSTERVKPMKPSESAIPLAELIRSVTFRLLAAAFFLASMAILGTVVQFVPMLMDWGLPPGKAGATAGLIGMTAIGSRLLIGALLDRAPPLIVTASVFVCMAGGLVALAYGGVPIAAFAAVAIGLGIGAEADLIAFLVSRYFTARVYGQTYGALYTVFLIGGAIGPAISGYLQQASGDYRQSLYGAAALLIVAAFFTLLLRRVAIPNGSVRAAVLAAPLPRPE